MSWTNSWKFKLPNLWTNLRSLPSLKFGRVQSKRTWFAVIFAGQFTSSSTTDSYWTFDHLEGNIWRLTQLLLASVKSLEPSLDGIWSWTPLGSGFGPGFSTLSPLSSLCLRFWFLRQVSFFKITTLKFGPVFSLISDLIKNGIQLRQNIIFFIKSIIKTYKIIAVTGGYLVILLMLTSMCAKISISTTLSILTTCSTEFVTAEKKRKCGYEIIVWARIWLLAAPFVGATVVFGKLVPQTVMSIANIVGGLLTAAIVSPRTIPLPEKSHNCLYKMDSFDTKAPKYQEQNAV